jgi:hypothetical protein
MFLYDFLCFCGVSLLDFLIDANICRVCGGIFLNYGNRVHAVNKVIVSCWRLLVQVETCVLLLEFHWHPIFLEVGLLQLPQS